MSRPNYAGFETDLNTMQAKIEELESALTEAFAAKFEKKQIKEPAAGYYESMKGTLAYLKQSINTLKAGEIEPEKLAQYDYEQRDQYNRTQERAWNSLRNSVEDYRPLGMPRIPYKKINEKITEEALEARLRQHAESFTQELDDPDVRKIWDLSQQLSDLSLDVDMIEQQDKYRELKGDIDAHCAGVRVFGSTLREFDADLSERENYGDVLREKNAAQKRLAEEQAEYDYQHSPERMQERASLLEVQKKNYRDQLTGKTELNEKLTESQAIINGYRDELAELNEQIEEEASLDSQRKEETAQLRQRLAQNEEALQRVNADSAQQAKKTEEYRLHLEQEQSKLDDLQKELERYADPEAALKPYTTQAKERYHSAPSGEMKKAAANEAELAHQYQSLLDAQTLLNQYTVAMDDAMKLADPGNTSVEARMTLIAQGRNLVQNGQDITANLSQDSEEVQRVQLGAMNAYAAHEQYKELIRQKFPVKPETLKAMDSGDGDLLTQYLSGAVMDASKSVEEILEKDRELTRLYPDEAETHQQRMDAIRQLGEQGNGKELQAYAEEKANQTVYTDLRKNQPPKGVSPAAAQAAQNEADLAYSYEMEQQAQRVYDAYLTELKAAGFDTLTPAKREDLLSRGNTYAKHDSSAMRMLRRVNKDVINTFKMKDIQERYCKELREKCGVSQESAQKALTSTEKLSEYLRDSVELYRQQQEKLTQADAALELTPAERAIHNKTMGGISEAYGRLKTQGEMIGNSELVYLTSKAQEEISQAKKAEIETVNQQHMEKIRKNENGGDLPELLAKKAEVVEKLNGEKTTYNAYSGALDELRHNNDATAEKISELENEVAVSEENLARTKQRAEKADSCEKKTTELIDLQRDLMTGRKELDEKLNPRGQNSAVVTMWDRSCHKITEKLQHFRDTADYGKPKGHKDGVHYTEMLKQLDEFLSENSGGLMGRDPEALRRKLEQVGQAAQAYIDTRSKDWFKSSSTIRQTRTAYAQRLVKYTEKAAADLQKMGLEDQALKEKTKELNTSVVDQPEYGAKLFDNMKQIGAKNILEKAQAERQRKLAQELVQNSPANQKDLNKDKKPLSKGFGS